jgi:hypothetical protein
MIVIFQNGMARQNAVVPKAAAEYLIETDVPTVNVATTQEKPNTPIALFMDGFALSPMAALVLTEDNQETRES